MTKKKNNHKEEEEQDQQITDSNESAQAQEEYGEGAMQEEESNEAEMSEQEKYDELNRKYLLLYSDFDNFRKRSMREKADIITRASGEVIKDLLGILDDFERAIANNENVEDPETLKEGFQLIHHKLLNTLKSKGLEPMDAKGDVFDPEKHEAITQIAVEDKGQKGKVVDVVERGYNLKGTPLRYAKVVVGQ
ncbi:MAG: nucleotide exchange factor GrpE [Crocinitomicaceae bacterium]